MMFFIETCLAYLRKLTGLQRLKDPEDHGHQGQQIGQAIRFCVDQQNGDASRFQVLLIFNSAIDSKKYLEPRVFSKRQQFPILFPSPTFFGHTFTLVGR